MERSLFWGSAMGILECFLPASELIEMIGNGYGVLHRRSEVGPGLIPILRNRMDPSRIPRIYTL